jgi:hypothetical protein
MHTDAFNEKFGHVKRIESIFLLKTKSTIKIYFR